MNFQRRQFLLDAAGCALSSTVPASLGPHEATSGTRLILLGTKGGPRVSASGRRNAATLLLINGVPYLVDCGYGTTLQLLAAGVPLDTLRYILITHHHSDHTLDFGAIVYNAWATGLPIALDAFGPPGLVAMTDAFFRYMQVDIDTRIADEGRPDPRKLVVAHEIAGPGVVLRNDDVIVRALTVRHPPLKHAYALRFDANDRSVVVSGDTAPSSELADFAKGADVLVHEVMYLPRLEGLIRRAPNATRLRAHLLATHTVPEDIGRLATRAGVSTVVLSHLVPGDDPSITDEQWSEGVRKHYKGRIVVGKDLMEI